MWCIQEITAEYRKRMYDILDLYAKDYDRDYPVVCFDEKSKQLMADARKPIPARQGQVVRYDYEYKRHGTCNIFVAVEPKGGRHVIGVTKRRQKADFAKFMQQLVNKVYPGVHRIRMVLDNLNTHFEGSLFETFDRDEAERILDKIEFHYTPKHASWLNMAEIEINMMDRECLSGRRIPTEIQLSEELKEWGKGRNKTKTRISWNFTRKDADKKLGKYYIV
jgi:hypothetical protein